MLSVFTNLFRKANAQKGHAVRAIAHDSKRSFWALADQGVVSIGNFGVNIVLARHFAHRQHLGEYGAFWVLMELMFFLNGIQGAILIYPLTIRGAVLERGALGKIASESLILTTIAAPLLLLSMIVTALIAHIPFAVGLWAGVAVLCWQLQETSRRALIAHLRFRAACIGEIVSYLGQFAAIALLSRLDMLDLRSAFQAIALTSAVACLLQLLQLGPRSTTFKDVAAFAREGWRIGRWILYGNFTNVFSGPLFNWNLAYWGGLEMLGVYQALINLIRPANPLGFAVATLITPTAAKTLGTEGMSRARIRAIRLALLGGILLLPYLAFLFIMPKLSLSLFYRQEAVAYLQYSSLVRLCAIAVGLVYVCMASGAFLNGIGRARRSFIGQLTYAGTYLLFVMPMTALFGLQGAIMGWLTAAFLQAAVNLYHAGVDSTLPQIISEPAQKNAPRHSIGRERTAI